MANEIHPAAVIDEGAVLGDDSVVGPYAVIGPNTRIGARCRIGPHAVIHPFTTLGEGCVIHAGAVLGDLPQDLAFEEVESYVTIGDRCVLREGVNVHRGTADRSVTEIGEECYLMSNVHVAHNSRLGRNVVVTSGAVIGGHADVGDQVFIGGLAAVHQFVRIGRLAMIGGLSGVTKDVPPFLTTVPVQLNRILGPNTVGLRRAGLSLEDRRAVRDAFRTLYRSGLNTEQALARLKADPSSGVTAEIVAFIERSKRGICRKTGESDAGEKG